MRGCCGRARNSVCAWCIRHPADPKAGARSNGSSAPCANSSWSRSTDTSSEDLAAAGVDHATALLELNRLFIAWVETEYHRRTHTETGQSPLARWEAGWDRLGRTPAMPTAADLTEAFLWSRIPRGDQDRHRVAARQHLPGRPGAGRAQGGAGVLPVRPGNRRGPLPRQVAIGKALPHTISRHAHPKAKPETPDPSRRRGPGSTIWR